MDAPGRRGGKSGGPVNAIKALSSADTDAVIPFLSRIALHDPFWAVRARAISALNDNYTQSDSMKQIIRSTLLAACHDTNSPVRDAAVSGLPMRAETMSSRRSQGAERFKLHGGGVGAPDAHQSRLRTRGETLLEHMNTPSYRNVITNAVLEHGGVAGFHPGGGHRSPESKVRRALMDPVHGAFGSSAGMASQGRTWFRS